jgi:hypothetical protein
VLVVKDQATLQKKLAGLFSSQSLADLGKKQGPKCPPPPAGFPNLNPTAAPTATPSVTPTSAATAQS